MRSKIANPYLIIVGIPLLSIALGSIALCMLLVYRVVFHLLIILFYLGLICISSISICLGKENIRLNIIEANLKKHLDNQINHYTKLSSNYEFLSELVHDFKNHIYCIHHLNKYNRSQELTEYLEKLLVISNTKKVFDTGNPVIDAILSEKKRLAEEKDISFKCDLNIPRKLKIDYIDICAILGNALDNAIEACQRIEESVLRKFVYISIRYYDSYIAIQIKNSFSKNARKKPFLHFRGYGRKSIERAVKKYQGNIIVQQEDNQYHLKIIMSQH